MRGGKQQDDTRTSKNSIVTVTVAQHVHHGVVLVKPTSYAGINEQNAAEVLLLPWSKPQWFHRKGGKPRAGRAERYSQRRQGSEGRARTHSRS